VARSLDPARWPFEAGDRIVGLAGSSDSLKNLSDLVGVLRGRTGAVPLVVERRSRRQTVVTHPTLRKPLLERYGIMIDGALLAPVDYEDEPDSPEAVRLAVHFVESASTALSLGIQPGDILYSVDGHRFNDLEALAAYLHGRPESKPLEVVLKRSNSATTSAYDYLARTLPYEEVKTVGPVETPAVAGRLSARPH